MSKIKEYIPHIALAVLCAFCFFAGWQINGWRLNAAVMRCEAEKSNNTANTAIAANQNMANNLVKISEGVDGLKARSESLNTAISGIKKEVKNANILPVDCRLDAVRLRGIADGTRAANDTAAR